MTSAESMVQPRTAERPPWHMDTPQTPEAPRAPVKGPARAILRPITERDLAFAAAGWLAGGAFTAEGTVCGKNLRLRVEGDVLSADGHPILDRRAREIVAVGNSVVEREARPLCSYVLRGDHTRMWRGR